MSTKQQDRSLLLAVLAMQNGFANQRQLIELLNHWSLNRRQTIEHLLQERIGLSADDVGLLTRLVERQLETHGDVEASLSHQTATFDLLDTNDQILDQEIRSALDSAAAASVATFRLKSQVVARQPAEPAGTIAAPSRASRSGLRNTSTSFAESHEMHFNVNESTIPATSRFDILRSHAKGGLGEVYLARDRELDREVALKEIQSRFCDDQTARQRFELEACITGGLEHPGVVPVYGYGHYPDGRPYYAMRFIRGVSMKDEISAYHQLPKIPAHIGERRLALRQLLRRFVDSCNAIGYAHSRGVLHRDIKPANIMLGKFGETLVVDWGLAKSVGRDTHYEDSEEKTLVPHSGSLGSATLLGSALGTPSYMSPEQAQGQFDRMGPPADIFSLGATLYTILTGQPPYEGRKSRDLVELAKKCKYRRPREVRTDVPRPLEAICLRAMAADADQRYATALDLARDVENFLADERVSAYRETLPERCGRWLRRHRTFTAALAVLVISVAVAAVVAAVLVNAERERTVVALEKLSAEETRTRSALEAEQSARRQTREALNTVTDDLVGELLSRQMQLTDSDRRFLQRVLDQFQQFTESSSGSPEARYVQADGFLRVGNLQRRLGEWDSAEESYMQAIRIWNSLLATEKSDSPMYVNLQQDLAAAESNRAMLAAEQGNDKQALVGYSSAAQRLKGLIEQVSHNAGFVAKTNYDGRMLASDSDSPQKLIDKLNLELGRIHNNLGNTASRLLQWEAAIDHFDAAFESLAAVSQSEQTLLDRGRTLGNQAGLLTRLPNRVGDVEATYRRAMELLADVSAESPHLSMALWERAAFARSLADWLMKQQRLPVAVDLLSEAVRIQSELVEEYPLRATWRQELARSLEGWAVATRSSDPELARDRLSQAIRIRRDLADLSSDPRRRDELVAAEINYANWLRVAEEYESAIDSYRPLRDRLTKSDGSIDRLLRAVLFGLGDSYMKTQQYPAALECWTPLCSNTRDPDWERFELQRALCLIRTGEVDEGLTAAVAVSQVTALPVLLYDTACCYAVALEVSGDQTTDEQRDEWGTKALHYMEQAAERGFFDDESMRRHAATDSDLQSLRDLPKFIEFCERMGIGN